jgi:predicted GNAT family acetyltransferase
MLEIRDERDEYRYGAYLDGRRVGHAAWVLVRRTVVLPHIRVERRYHDAGVGSLLAHRAFDDARAEGNSVLPWCPFMRRWAQLHPGYRDVARRPRPGEVSSIRSAVAATALLEELTAAAARRPGSRAGR